MKPVINEAPWYYTTDYHCNFRRIGYVDGRAFTFDSLLFDFWLFFELELTIHKRSSCQTYCTMMDRIGLGLMSPSRLSTLSFEMVE